MFRRISVLFFVLFLISAFAQAATVNGNLNVNGNLVNGAHTHQSSSSGGVLAAPSITSFSNANHSHQNSSGGGTLDVSAIGSGILPLSRGGTGVTSSTGIGGSVVLSNSPTIITPFVTGNLTLQANYALFTDGGVDDYITNGGYSNRMEFWVGGAEQIRLLGGTINTQDHFPLIDNTYTLGVSGKRWTTVYATNGTIQTSDKRNKKEIKSSDLGLDFINQIRPVSYRWKNNDNGKHYGFIAQEVLETLDGRPFAGIQGGEKEGYGMNYSELIAPLVKSVQELDAKVKNLESRLAKYEK